MDTLDTPDTPDTSIVKEEIIGKNPIIPPKIIVPKTDEERYVVFWQKYDEIAKLNEQGLVDEATFIHNLALGLQCPETEAEIYITHLHTGGALFRPRAGFLKRIE